jgi:hypothetical protein
MLLGLAALPAMGQSIRFHRTFPVIAEGRMDFQRLEINQAADNTYVIGSFEDRNLFLMRFDRFGNVTGTRLVDIPAEISPTFVNTSTALDNAGNLYVGVSLRAAGLHKNVLMKFGPNLNTVFQTQLPGNRTIIGVHPNSLGSVTAVVFGLDANGNASVDRFGSTGLPLTSTSLGRDVPQMAIKCGPNVVIALGTLPTVLKKVEIDTGTVTGNRSISETFKQLEPQDDSFFLLATQTNSLPTLRRVSSAQLADANSSTYSANHVSVRAGAGSILWITQNHVRIFNSVLTAIDTVANSNAVASGQPINQGSLIA